MNIEMITAGNSVIARIEGTMDAISVANDRDAASRVLDSAAGGVELDLASVSFMDASGLGFISHIVKRSRVLGITVTVVNANGQPAEFLKSLGLTKVLNINTVPAKNQNVETPAFDASLKQAA